MAGDAAFVVGDEADELTWNPGLFLPDECGTADEVAFCELDQPAEVGLEGRRGVVDIVAVKRHPHLEAQGIAGAKPARGDTTRPDQRLPERHRITIVEVELEAVLTGVSRTRYDRRTAGDRSLDEVIVADAGEVGLGERLEQARRFRALQGKEGDVVALVVELGVESR